MSLMIRQGKQDTSNDGFNFEPFEEKNVLAVIEKLEVNQYLPGNMNVFLRLLTGSHKKSLQKVLVPYDPSNAGSWKYRSLRNCAGVPYDKNEPEQIDIEALLKDKIVMVDFTIFINKNKDNAKQQDYLFKKPSQEALDEAFPKADIEELEDLAELPQNPEPAVEPSPLKEAEEAMSTPVEVSQINDDEDWE